MSLSTLALLCSAKLISLFHIFFYFYCSSLPRLALVDTKIQSFVWHCICVTAAGLFSFCSISASWSKPDRDAASFTQTHTFFFLFSQWWDLVVCSDLLLKPTTYPWTLSLWRATAFHSDKRAWMTATNKAVILVVGAPFSSTKPHIYHPFPPLFACRNTESRKLKVLKIRSFYIYFCDRTHRICFLYFYFL